MTQFREALEIWDKKYPPYSVTEEFHREVDWANYFHATWPEIGLEYLEREKRWLLSKDEEDSDCYPGDYDTYDYEEDSERR